MARGARGSQAGTSSRTTQSSYRFKNETAARLVERARKLGISRNQLAERYIEEGLRRDEHPLIYFREGAVGRRPALLGTRLDVWQVIDTVRNEGGSVSAAARYLDQPEAKVAAAVSYYADYKDEVDAFGEAARAAAAKAEAAWARERAALAS